MKTSKQLEITKQVLLKCLIYNISTSISTVDFLEKRREEKFEITKDLAKKP